MLNLSTPSPGLSFGSVIYRSDLYAPEYIQKIWQDQFGPSFFLVSEFNPSFDYYKKEMQGELSRFLILTTQTCERDTLLDSKKWALRQEEQSVQNGSRTINWDTGLLTSESFFLATTKTYAHRFYMGEALFCELTLYQEHGKWLSLPWTYADYTHPQKLDFLSWGRSFLLEKLLQKAQDLL